MRRLTRLCLVSLVALVGACTEQPGDGGGGGGLGDPEGKIILNGLVLDFAAVDTLSTAALAAEDSAPLLLDESEHGALLATSGGEELLSYLVTCALGEDQDLELPDGTVFTGTLGLAPEWGSESCGSDCQRWVSACILAHSNAQGNPVLISPRGDHPVLGFSAAQAEEYSYEEAAFYGNLFLDASERELYACSGDSLIGTATGSDETGIGIGDAFLSGRVCGADEEQCGFVHTGLCSDTLLAGVPTGLDFSTCARDADGYFVNCSTTAAEDAGELGHTGSARYDQVITVYLDF